LAPKQLIHDAAKQKQQHIDQNPPAAVTRTKEPSGKKSRKRKPSQNEGNNNDAGATTSSPPMYNNNNTTGPPLQPIHNNHSHALQLLGGDALSPLADQQLLKQTISPIRKRRKPKQPQEQCKNEVESSSSTLSIRIKSEPKFLFNDEEEDEDNDEAAQQSYYMNTPASNIITAPVPNQQPKYNSMSPVAMNSLMTSFLQRLSSKTNQSRNVNHEQQHDMMNIGNRSINAHVTCSTSSNANKNSPNAKSAAQPKLQQAMIQFNNELSFEEFSQLVELALQEAHIFNTIPVTNGFSPNTQRQNRLYQQQSNSGGSPSASTQIEFMNEHGEYEPVECEAVWELACDTSIELHQDLQLRIVLVL